ncbi:MAG: glycosyltransferase family 2 protein [Alphaproteobacteria bacterium]
MVEISAVVPVYNEEENVTDLVNQIRDALESMARDYEIIIVDDGSSDRTRDVLDHLATTVPGLRPVHLARNYGQSTAMQAGFDQSTGDIVVTLDGDLQNDPNDIPKLVGILEEERVDLVSGWRKDRHDGGVRVFLSRMANRLISRTTGVSLHDYGCSLKAYRGDVVRQIRVYGELHRFIPALVAEVGGEVREVVVNHRPRTRGTSKYGLDRTLRVALDLMLIVFLRKYLQRPLHIFGGLGILLGVIGAAISAYLAVVKFGLGEEIGGRPLLFFAGLLLIASVFLVVQGLLGEVLVRLLHQSHERPQYRLRLPRMTDRSVPSAAAVTELSGTSTVGR